MNQPQFGCRMPLEEWMELNRVKVFTNPELKRYVSPFPPIELMANVSGLQNERDFAAHGTDNLSCAYNRFFKAIVWVFFNFGFWLWLWSPCPHVQGAFWSYCRLRY